MNLHLNDDAANSEVERLQQECDRAWARELDAAQSVAYDVTFRAADPRPDDCHHQRATPELTEEIKARYVEAVAARKAAREALNAALHRQLSAPATTRKPQ